MFAIRGHGRESEGSMNMFRVETAGAQSLAGALPLHRLSCKAEDDVKSERDAHDLILDREGGKKKHFSCFVGASTANICERRVNLLVCSLPLLHRHSYIGLVACAPSIHNKLSQLKFPSSNPALSNNNKQPRVCETHKFLSFSL